MNATQTVDLHDVDAYLKSRNLVDDMHRPYYLRWLQRFLAGPWGTGRLAPKDALAAFAQHLVNIREVQQYLGHASVEPTMIYTHVIRGLDSTAESPLDALGLVSYAKEMEHDFKCNEMHVLVHLLVHTSSWPSGPSSPTEAPISSACKKLAVEFLLFLCNEDEDEKETIQRVHV